MRAGKYDGVGTDTFWLLGHLDSGKGRYADGRALLVFPQHLILFCTCGCDDLSDVCDAFVYEYSLESGSAWGL